MMDFERGFRIDDKPIAWGTSLADAARIVGVRPSGIGRIGYSSLRVPCGQAWGFGTLSAQLTGHGLSRPVTSLAYELLPSAGGAVEPGLWTGVLKERLGPPVREEIEDVSGRPDPWDAVGYYANWDRDDYSVGLSIYGALREVPEGMSAGTLWLSWSTELAAAPFLAEWRSACEGLAVAAKGSGPVRTFSLGINQYACRSDGSEPRGKARLRREASIALTAPDVLLTPKPVAERLTPRMFALWSNPHMKLHCLSTRWDSVIWDEGAAREIDWWHVLPAKGGGRSELHVGNWSVFDYAGSTGVRDAAAALAAIRGVTVNYRESYDC